MAWGDIIGAVATLGAGLIGSRGASAQNAASAKAAQTQMAFQERMRRTQYQTTMEDMRLAGLNPILAYKQGGAGTPGGSTYSPVNVGGAAVTGASAGASSALAARRFAIEKERTIAEISKLYTSAAKDSADEKLAHAQSRVSNQNRKLLEQQEKMNQPDVSSAKHAQELYEGPGGSFFKWWQMIKRR